MPSFQQQQKMVAFLRAALECSVFVAPTDAGLTFAELQEVGRQAGYLPGELSDAIRQSTLPANMGHDGRFLPDQTVTAMWLTFQFEEQPDFRNVDALNFVFSQMHAIGRMEGARNAKIDRSVLVERAINADLSGHDVQVAITMVLLSGVLREDKRILSFVSGREQYAPPSAQQRIGSAVRQNEARSIAHPLVKDVLARRSDGRAHSAEPLEAFTSRLERLGHGRFRMWWAQMAAELRQINPQTSPVSATVIAAALVEGALTFAVKHAKTLELGVMGSKKFDQPPTNWRIDELVTSAAMGGDSAILDSNAQQRANSLVRTRQRIHAGRMLVDFPEGPPDLRPEEARDAIATAEIVIRRITEWLERYPGQGE